MHTWHYESSPTETTEAGTVIVEHMYGLDHNRWSASHEATLIAILRRLPGYEPNAVGWFRGQLLGSTEPPGLQVFGEVQLRQWLDWHARFVAEVEASNIPVKFIAV